MIASLAPTANAEPLRAVTFVSPPWVDRPGETFTGFHAELWRAIAKEAGLDFEMRAVASWPEMRDRVIAGEADIAIQQHAIRAAIEDQVDFSQAVFDDGMQVLVPTSNALSVARVIAQFAGPPLAILGWMSVIVLIVAHLMWFAERNRVQSDFRAGYLAGIWDAVYWSIVTVTTVGYGDKSPKSNRGRVVALGWMLAGLFLLSMFVAQVTAAFTVDSLQTGIQGEADLPGRTIGTYDGGKQLRYLRNRGIAHAVGADTDAVVQLLRDGKVEALLLDVGNARYATSRFGDYVEPAGPAFARGHIGYPMRPSSPHREAINQAVLRIREDGTYQRIMEKYFGPRH